MPRTILVHLNIQVPDDDERTPPEIAEAVEAALEVGSDDDSVRNLALSMSLRDYDIHVPLVEEVG